MSLNQKDQAALQEETTRTRPLLWSEVPAITVLLINAFWIAAWHQIAVKADTRLGIILPVLAVTMLASHYLARWLNSRQISPGLQRTTYFFWILFSLLFSLDLILFTGHLLAPGPLIEYTFLHIFKDANSVPQFWHLFIFLLAILRSLALARRPVSRDQVSRAFRVGVVMLLFSGFTYEGQIPVNILPVFYGLLFTGLMGLSISHFVDLAESSGGRLPAFGGKWALGITLAVVGFVAAAALAGWLIDENVAGVLAEILLAGFMVFSVLLMLVLAPLLAIILEVSNRIGKAIFANSPDLLPQFTADEAFNELRETGEENLFLFSELFARSKGVLMLSILAVIVVLVILIVRWKPWERRLRTEEGISSEAQRAPKPKPNQDQQSRPSLLKRARQWLASARILNVYAQLMRLCVRLEMPRPPATTPLEFLPHMETLFPDYSAELKEITAAYLKVRYGEIPETPQEVQAIQDAWSRVKKAGNQLKRSPEASR